MGIAPPNGVMKDATKKYQVACYIRSMARKTTPIVPCVNDCYTKRSQKSSGNANRQERLARSKGSAPDVADQLWCHRSYTYCLAWQGSTVS